MWWSKRRDKRATELVQATRARLRTSKSKLVKLLLQQIDSLQLMIDSVNLHRGSFRLAPAPENSPLAPLPAEPTQNPSLFETPPSSSPSQKYPGSLGDICDSSLDQHQMGAARDKGQEGTSGVVEPSIDEGQRATILLNMTRVQIAAANFYQYIKLSGPQGRENRIVGEYLSPVTTQYGGFAPACSRISQTLRDTKNDDAQILVKVIELVNLYTFLLHLLSG